MIVKSSVTNLLLSSLSGLNKNQEVISSNISNVDTPNFKAKEFDFEGYINNSRPGVYEQKQKQFFEYNLPGSKTDNAHFDINSDFDFDLHSMSINEADSFIMQNDKNNINIDEQNTKMSKNQLLTSAVLGIYKNESTLFKQVIENSSRLN